WITGFLLLGLVLGFAFTGSLLPWNTLAYFATRIGVSLPESSMPAIGPVAANALRGGADVSGATLTRMYSAHVVALPMATIIVVILHLLFLQIFGLSIPIGARRKGGRALAASLGGVAAAVLIAWPIAMGTFDPLAPPVLAAFVVLPVVIAYLLSGMASPAVENADGTSPGSIPFYSNFIYRDLLCWLITFGIIVTLVIAVPWRGGGSGSMPVDLTRPLATPTGIHPEWYFMFAFQLLRAVPGTLAVIVLTLLGAGVLAVPLLDRRAARGERSAAMTVLGIAIAVALAGLTVWGYLSLATE
ncbi:MAG: cytochrome b N-terminal domain-containing protein, partial [Bacteroidota bacterium]